MSEWDAFEPEFARSRAAYLPLLNARQRREVVRKRRDKEFEKHRVLAWQALRQADVTTARKHALETFRRAKLATESWRLMYCALRGR